MFLETNFNAYRESRHWPVRLLQSIFNVAKIPGGLGLASYSANVMEERYQKSPEGVAEQVAYDAAEKIYQTRLEQAYRTAYKEAGEYTESGEIYTTALEQFEERVFLFDPEKANVEGEFPWYINEEFVTRIDSDRAALTELPVLQEASEAARDMVGSGVWGEMSIWLLGGVLAYMVISSLARASRNPYAY